MRWPGQPGLYFGSGLLFQVGVPAQTVASLDTLNLAFRPDSMTRTPVVTVPLGTLIEAVQPEALEAGVRKGLAC